MTHWSHFPCLKHTHCALVVITNQRLEQLWVVVSVFFFFIKGWKHFFTSAFHMLHNAVPAHRSHVAGLTRKNWHKQPKYLKSSCWSVFMAWQGRRTKLQTFACSLSKLRCLALEKVSQAVVASVSAPVPPLACQHQPETSAGFAHRTDLVLFIPQRQFETTKNDTRWLFI